MSLQHANCRGKRTVGPIHGPDTLGDAFLSCHASYPFEAANGHISPVNAWWMAELSFAVYLDEAPLRGLAAQGKLPFASTGIRYFSWAPAAPLEGGSAGVQAAIFLRDDCSIVAFRGSDTAAVDWLTNAALKLMKTQQGQVHNGFRRAIHGRGTRWPEMRLVLADHGQPVWFTGHSQGAALAMIAALDARAHLLPVAGIYTYGSPRAGDDAFAAAAPQPLFRVVNPGDPVTQVPPRIPGLLPYRHAGKRLWLSDDGSLQESDPPTAAAAAVQGLLDAAAGGADAAVWRRALEAHSMRRYAAKLWNFLVD